jgi:hypothetical protein
MKIYLCVLFTRLKQELTKLKDHIYLKISFAFLVLNVLKINNFG